MPKDLMQLIAEQDGVAQPFAQLFRTVVEEPCWACSGGIRAPAYGKCMVCAGRNVIATERGRA